MKSWILIFLTGIAPSAGYADRSRRTETDPVPPAHVQIEYDRKVRPAESDDVCSGSDCRCKGPENYVLALASPRKNQHSPDWRRPTKWTEATPDWASPYLKTCRNDRKWSKGYQCGNFAKDLCRCVGSKFPDRSVWRVRITGCYDEEYSDDVYQHQMVIVRDACPGSEGMRGYAAISTQSGGSTACKWEQPCKDSAPVVPARCHVNLCLGEPKGGKVYVGSEGVCFWAP
jgi:hypothetical protein